MWETAKEMAVGSVSRESTDGVVRGEAELPRLRPGEVLVCPTTHSIWAVVFGRAGALVTDSGGMLSHPAILAREYDMPAVVAAGRATSLLIDGQIVTVDSTTGRVEFFEP